MEIIGELHKAAKERGIEAGLASASWVFDGNTPRETYARVLKGIQDGDPVIYDSYSEPSLSGEFQGSETLITLCLALDVDPHAGDGELQQELADDWEEGSSEGFWQEIERICIHQLGE